MLRSQYTSDTATELGNSGLLDSNSCMQSRAARGDCWLVAVAASIAYVDANKIKEMMIDRRVSYHGVVC